MPFKTCNWNCVYCQLGRTTPLTRERREYVPTEELLAEVGEALAAHRAGGIDWVTFVGSGETTLHSGLGRMIRAVKTMTSLPVAVITNGSLLDLAEVREELLPADAVLPTLDAGSESLYRAINRPWPGLTLSFRSPRRPAAQSTGCISHPRGRTRSLPPSESASIPPSSLDGREGHFWLDRENA